MMDELFTLFNEIGLPYFRQGSLSDADYPTSFFTFWNIDSPTTAHRDNKTKTFVELISVCFYTNNANLIYSQMNDFVERAKTHGFIVQGNPRDTVTDKDNYFGRYILIKKINHMED